MPEYLYKIVSEEMWKKGQLLGPLDDEFIHFSTEEQLPRIIDKFWADEPKVLVLKVDVKQLVGRLVYEANPGGTNKYYHLYEGSIPLSAVVSVQLIKDGE